MAKFFGNLNAVLVAGLVALIALLAVANQFGAALSIVIFLHVLSGIMWIGHLYYFNFTQIPTMPKIPAELKPAVGKYIAPAALFWFRWGAAFTVLTGLAVIHLKGDDTAFALAPGFRLIGIGMYLALFMAANVWFFIWPNQKKALGIVEADADTKAKSASLAMMGSRTNTLLSIPMLYCMVAQSISPW